MKHLDTIIGRLALLLLLPGVGHMAQAQDVDCNLDFTIEQGCSPDGTGYALITDLVNAITPYEHVWSNGANTQFVAGLANNDYSVTLADAAGCSLTKNFTIDCEKKDEEEEEEEPEPCQLRTQTMGGWGAPANGNNPGAYRNAHFAAAFPGGLVIGCNYTLTLTSAQAVQNFLPSGGQAKKLTANLLNPTNYKNVLAGQLVALTLSVGFDNNDPDFGTGGLLADAVINNGTFNGWTVQQLLDEANNFIGGCASSYSAGQLNTALTMVNENFVDGTTNNGDLDCAEGGGDKMFAAQGIFSRVLVFPNPATDRVQVDLSATVDANVTLMMVDAMGRQAMPASQLRFHNGEQRITELNVSTLNNGSYMLILQSGDVRHVERIIIAR